MTPEDTPRMAERTDRQAQIDPWAAVADALRALPVQWASTEMQTVRGAIVSARSADAALLRERDAQIASLDAHIERQNTFIGILDKRIVDSGVAQEALGSKLVMAESVAKNNYDACERARAERDAAQQEAAKWKASGDVMEAEKVRALQDAINLQQENKTLREALVRYGDHLPLCSEVPCSCGYDAALSASPRPQEPQP